MSNKEELRELDKVDINFVNKKLTVFSNVPPYALLFFLIPFFALLTFNPFIIAVFFLISLFLFQAAVFFTKNNITFFYFFSALSYIFKPKYIIILKEDFFEKRLKNEN